MPIFLILSVILTIVSLLMLVPALFNRRKLSETDLQEENLSIARQRLAEIDNNDASAEEARVELEAALIDDLDGPTYAINTDKSAGRWSAMIVLALIPLSAGLIYLQLGNHNWNKQVAMPSVEQIEENPTRGIELLLARLEQVLVEQPDDAAGWELAARTYMGTQQFAKAEHAYARVHELSGEHPDTLTAWADASLMVNNNQFSEEIASRVTRALEMDPQHISALWLAAMGARSNGSNDIALAYLNRLLPLVEGNPEAARETRAVIASLDGSVANNQSPASSAGTEVEHRAVEPRVVNVKLSLSPELASRVTADDSVFVFATEKDGPPAPLAAVRMRVDDLPATVQLDQSSAMIPGRTIDGPASIEIKARIALGEKPTGSPGDLESQAMEITAYGSSEIILTIDSVAR